MNIATVCAFLRIAVTLLRAFDKEGKAAAILAMLETVNARLCGEDGPFGDAKALTPKQSEAADKVVEALKEACDCDDCECE
jgi:hypothetical protein